ncbi:SCO2522 family protein [Phytomonospora sp. NPDC050363]|uniref:SCO2522 family protein n=1 Tax=Phytomonospora sp. NPDC050363 TaxID=3155642 RepID=UPI0033CD9A86
MSPGEATFTEYSAQPKTASTPLAHLSIELGHLYAEDIQAGPERLRTHFKRVKPWLAAAENQVRDELAGRTPRISTCFMLDDYFTPLDPPAKLIPQILEAAEDNDVRIDYLAHEAGCARSGEISPAKLVEARLVEDPTPGTNGGFRPTVSEVGWLSNGSRSPTGADEAMQQPADWAPPRENAVIRHSVFLDVELWTGTPANREWSCPFLAAVWQLLRLGLLRDKGAAVVPPRVWTPTPSDTWSEVPTVIEVNPKAQPFSAYRTFSILDARFLHIEHAVRTIVGQVAIEGIVAEMVAGRAAGEKLAHPGEAVNRMEYVFTGRPWPLS